MNVIRLEMSFQHFTFSLSGQFVKHFTKVLAQLAIQSFFTTFRYPNHMVLAFPFRVAYSISKTKVI